MFKLTIKFQNGDVYWTEFFNSMDQLNDWLDAEVTRPYWSQNFTTEVEDLTPPGPTQEEIEAENERVQQVALLRSRVKELANQSDLTASEVKEAIMKFIKIQLLNRILD